MSILLSSKPIRTDGTTITLLISTTKWLISTSVPIFLNGKWLVFITVRRDRIIIVFSSYVVRLLYTKSTFITKTLNIMCKSQLLRSSRQKTFLSGKWIITKSGTQFSKKTVISKKSKETSIDTCRRVSRTIRNSRSKNTPQVLFATYQFCKIISSISSINIKPQTFRSETKTTMPNGTFQTTTIKVVNTTILIISFSVT